MHRPHPRLQLRPLPPARTGQEQARDGEADRLRRQRNPDHLCSFSSHVLVARLTLSQIGSLLLALSFKNNEQYDVRPHRTETLPKLIPSLKWSHPLVWAPLVVFAVFLVGFGFVEAKFSREPVLPMRLLAMRSPFFIAWMNFIVSWNSFRYSSSTTSPTSQRLTCRRSVLYMFPLYFETVMLVSAASAGAHLVPNSVMLSLGSLFAGWYMRRTGKYYWLIVTSAVLPLVAFVMMAVMTRLDDGGGPALQWISILPSGFGISSLITALLSASCSHFPRCVPTEMQSPSSRPSTEPTWCAPLPSPVLQLTARAQAVGTGISYLARYTGQVIGVAVSSAVLQAVLAKELSRRITGPDSAQVRLSSTPCPACLIDVSRPAHRRDPSHIVDGQGSASRHPGLGRRRLLAGPLLGLRHERHGQPRRRPVRPAAQGVPAARHVRGGGGAAEEEEGGERSSSIVRRLQRR